MTNVRFEKRLLELRSRFVRSLPDRVAAIVESLRQRQDGISEPEDVLDRQFHNLAGTAGTFGLFAIAAAAHDGFEECADLHGSKIEGGARYLWSIVEELAYEAAGPLDFESNAETVFHPMHGAVASMDQAGQRGA